VVLIIGGGVAGLSASRCLRDAGISHTLVDRNDGPGGAYRRMYAATELSSPPAYLALPGAAAPRAASLVRATAYADYLTDYVRRNGIEISRREVLGIDREDDRFRVVFRDESHPTTFRAVIACTGSFDNPFVPDIPGLTEGETATRNTLPFAHAREWRGPSELGGRRLLIIGGGVTAVELAEESVRAGLRPVVSARSNRIPLFPSHVLGVNPRRFVYPFLRFLRPSVFRRQCEHGWRYGGIDRGFGRFRRERHVDVRPAVARVEDGRVTFVDGSTADVESVVFATGYRFDMPYISASLPRGGLGVPRQRDGRSVDWPGLFFLGVPCTSGGHSHFVHGIAADAPSVARSVARYVRQTERRSHTEWDMAPPAEPLDGRE
jgi:putative flavoprotein involved in K+ transport